MTGARIGLVSARVSRGLDDDQQPLVQALQALGAEVEVPEWDDPEVDWGRYTLALLRATWDYPERMEEFLAWGERVAALTRLLNPLPLVRWNTDKHYLRDLERAGVPIVPSRFIEPGEDPAAALEGFLGEGDRGQGGHAEVVVKPAVGAGSRDVRRHERRAVTAIHAHAEALLRTGRSVVVQPYLDRVDEEGETALIYLEGRFSHAIRKGPLLTRGAAATSHLFAPERITPRAPSEAERKAAEQVLAALAFPVPLYARIDLLQDEAGQPRLLELELTEPSLFFAHAPGTAERFAALILARAASR